MAHSARRRVITGISVTLVLGAIAGISAYLGYQAGGRVGFVDGFAAGSWSTDTTHALYSTFVLDKVHQGDIPGATSFLEQQVDSGLLSYWGYSLAGDSEFDRSGVVAKSHKVIRHVAAYRHAHPPYCRDGELGSTIQEVLAKIETEDE